MPGWRCDSRRVIEFMKLSTSSSIWLRKHGRTPGATSECMYIQWASPLGSDSTRMVGKERVRCSFSTLFMESSLEGFLARAAGESG